MNKLLAGLLIVVFSCGLCAGCSAKPDPNGKLSQAQIDQIKGFGAEMIAQYGHDQPPMETWVKEMPWLAFKRLELRKDGCYFVMEESDSEESGYVRVESVNDFYQAHGSDSAYQMIDAFLWRYKVRK